MTPPVLVAGIGNVFLSDDGFGVEVARRLASRGVPAAARVADFGIRGVHLAYELLNGYSTLILIDAAPRGEEPGTVSVIEATPQEAAAGGPSPAAIARGEAPALDSHGMDPAAVFSLLHTLGGRPPRVVVVGCEPASLEEGIGLTERVATAVDVAVDVVGELIDKEMRNVGSS